MGSHRDLEGWCDAMWKWGLEELPMSALRRLLGGDSADAEIGKFCDYNRKAPNRTPEFFPTKAPNVKAESAERDSEVDIA